MSVAVIQGSSKGIGLQFARLLLNNTSLKVVAASRKPDEARKAILDGLDGKDDRLTTLELDVLREDSIANAAKQVSEKYGKNSMRLLINVSGILKPEKAIEKINYEDALLSFQINTLGHMLTYKHFVPLLPAKRVEDKQDNDEGGEYLKPGLSVLASLTARVGSISDNQGGGWFSYRASKAATNQIIVSLNKQLAMRSAAPSIALALHPGTTITDLSEGYVKKDLANKKEGIHSADRSAQLLLEVIGRQTEKDGGKFLDYAGKSIPW